MRWTIRATMGLVLALAAAMPGWTLLGLILPPAWPLLQVFWSFKIARARGKSWVVGLLLLLPVTNLFAFLYLAFSGNGESDAPASNVISLGGPPKRAAAHFGITPLA